MTQDIYLTDLTRCKPAEGLSRAWCDGKWLLLDYETDDGPT